MALRSYLVDPTDNSSIDIQSGIGGDSTLISESMVKLCARWKSAVNDAVETIEVVAAKPNQSILITDIIMTSSKKVAASTITLQFDDGTNTETLFVMEGASAPIEFSHAFAGGIKGWKDADLQVVTDQAAMYAVTLIGYVHISEVLTQTYDAWDAGR